jgi:hypothetical protein
MPSDEQCLELLGFRDFTASDQDNFVSVGELDVPRDGKTIINHQIRVWLLPLREFAQTHRLLEFERRLVDANVDRGWC